MTATGLAVSLAQGWVMPSGAQMLLLALNRMPGLSNARAAYETGRALRMIIRLFDQAGAPATVAMVTLTTPARPRLSAPAVSLSRASPSGCRWR